MIPKLCNATHHSLLMASYNIVFADSIKLKIISFSTYISNPFNKYFYANVFLSSLLQGKREEVQAIFSGLSHLSFYLGTCTMEFKLSETKKVHLYCITVTKLKNVLSHKPITLNVELNVFQEFLFTDSNCHSIFKLFKGWMLADLFTVYLAQTSKLTVVYLTAPHSFLSAIFTYLTNYYLGFSFYIYIKNIIIYVHSKLHILDFLRAVPITLTELLRMVHTFLKKIYAVFCTSNNIFEDNIIVYKYKERKRIKNYSIIARWLSVSWLMSIARHSAIHMQTYLYKRQRHCGLLFLCCILQKAAKHFSITSTYRLWLTRV